MKPKKQTKIKVNNEAENVYFERFDPFSRFLHVLVIVSFLSLALTGMTIKFSGVAAFQTISSILGGYEVTSVIHRFAAIITATYFVLHLGHLYKKVKSGSIKLKELLTGEDSMVPNKKDFIEFYQTAKWFFGLGPRPKYGRWTYWEKFDYFAVFWGVGVIGSSGLLLWFPEFFTSLGIPGWMINVATIIHSDEALLATGFIFTVHFFNTHFRPEKFPMDTVIFTGSITLEELKEERPRQYNYLLKNNELDKYLTEAPSPKLLRAGRIFGFIALSIGVILVLLIIYSILFLYNY